MYKWQNFKKILPSLFYYWAHNWRTAVCEHLKKLCLYSWFVRGREEGRERKIDTYIVYICSPFPHPDLHKRRPQGACVGGGGAHLG